MGRVTTLDFDLGITVKGKLHVCLAQLPEPPVDAILSDAGRPVAVAAFEQLLAANDGHSRSALTDMVPGTDPVLIVFPELTFGSSDWEAIDAAIRKVNRPLIVQAGFGATLGSTLLNWADVPSGEGDTSRELAWDQVKDGISPARPVNGGWCWVHAPGKTRCITYLKTIPEQTVEAVKLSSLQFGRTITHLRFEDIDIFPVICADLLQPPSLHPDGAQARIADVLQKNDTSDRPALIVGSLLQKKYNVNWQRAIESLLNQVLAQRPGLVALANISITQTPQSDEQDQWRSLTGVFGKFQQLNKGQANLPCVRRVSTPHLVGAVVRYSTAMFTCGVIDWGPYSPVDGMFAWHATMHCTINTAGLVTPVGPPPEPHACEISRFLLRYPGDPKWSYRVREGIERIRAHLDSEASPHAVQLLDSLLHGPGECSVDPDNLYDRYTQAATEQGLHALATITTFDELEWQTTPGQLGQLRIKNSERNLLVWRDPVRTKAQMRAILSNWQTIAGAHPDLTVLGQSRFGDIHEGEVQESRRDDISIPPVGVPEVAGALAPEPSDFTLPNARRRVLVVNLAEVASIYTEGRRKGEDIGFVEPFLRQIDAWYAEEAA